MTGAANTSAEIDFFALHNRKKKRIDVEMLDYDHVAKCSDLDELKGILALLRSGKEGRYPHLEKITEDKILSLLPPRERERIQRMRAEPSPQELSAEKQDLLSWSEQIDAKHKALQTHKSASRRLPPVRGAAPVTTDLQKASSATAAARAKTQAAATSAVTELPEHACPPKETQAIPAYDFRAWEKYDADKALEEIDAEDERHKAQARAQREQQERRQRERSKELASLPTYVDFDALSREEREVYALYEKQKGNESFKANENDDAILYYTRSMAFDDSNAVVYANRAMAYLRIKSFAAAEQDCSRAVVLDPSYVKGWSRRGMTRFRRGKYADAAADFEHALRLEPGNRELEKLLEKTHAKWREVDGTVGARSNQDTDNDTSVQPASRTSSSHSTGSSDGTKTPPTAEAQPQQQDTESEVSDSKQFTRFAIIEESDAESDEDDDEPPRPSQQQCDEDDGSDSECEAAKPFQRFEILED